MTAPDDYYMTAGEVSAWTSLATGTLSAWRAQGRGPKSFRLGGRVVYRRSDVEAWIAAQEQATARGDVA